MELITFGKFNFNHIYFLFYAVNTLIRSIFSDLLFDNTRDDCHHFYSMYLIILSRSLSLIPYLINKKLSKRKNKKGNLQRDSINNKRISNFYKNRKNIWSKPAIISTIRVSIFEFLAELIISLFHFFNDNNEIVYDYSLKVKLIFNTVTQYLVSHFVLNYKFYSHHYLSFGINIFCILIFLIFDIIDISNKGITDYQFYIYIFVMIIRLFLFSLEDNYAKVSLFKYYYSPFSLLLFMAIEETIFLIIASIPFIFIKSNDNNEIIFPDFLTFLTGINLVYSIVIFICNFLYEAFLLIIVDRFSPSHIPLGLIIHAFLNNIYIIIKNSINNRQNEYLLYINFIIYIILFIAAMIHNEIFIINRCGFNKNTKKFLDNIMEEENEENIILPTDEENEEEEDTETEEDLFPSAELATKG